MDKIVEEVAFLNTIRFNQAAAVVMFAVAGVFLWFCFESVVWYVYAFTFAMAVISGIAGVTAWVSAKYEKVYRARQEEFLESQRLYMKLCDKSQELSDAYKELCGSYEELCVDYQILCDALQKKNRPEE